MKTDPVIRFLEVANTIRDQVIVIDELEQVLDHYGFAYYGVIRQPHSKDDPLTLMLAGHWPKGWPARYIQRDYLLIDPTMRFLRHAHSGFRWVDAVTSCRRSPQRRRKLRMMIDAYEFGLKDGYMFPVHGWRGLVGVLVVGGEPVDLTALEMINFDALAKTALWRLLRLSDPLTSQALSSAVDVQLTRREMEVLGFLADGMTSNEIATMLAISNHTVDWHLKAVQVKLKAKNRHHAVAIAFRFGLMA